MLRFAAFASRQGTLSQNLGIMVAAREETVNQAVGRENSAFGIIITGKINRKNEFEILKS